MTPRLRILIVLLLLAGAFAFSQSTLGNMFRLGGSTTANLPASSTLTVGALIYDLDAGRILVNDGTGWRRIPIVLSDGGIN